MFFVILGVLAVAGASYFWSRRRRPKPVRRKTSGVALAFGLAFSAVLDPAKKASVEELDRHRDLGKHDAGANGEKLD